MLDHLKSLVNVPWSHAVSDQLVVGYIKLFSSATTWPLLTGGLRDSSSISSLELYGQDCDVPPFQKPITDHVNFVTKDGRIAACGGVDYGTFATNSKCWTLNMEEQKWESGAIGNIQEDRIGSTVASLPLGVYILGGEGSVLGGSSSEFLPVNKDRWEAGPRLPEVMMYHCTVTISSTSFLLIGGHYTPKAVREYNAGVSGPSSDEGWQPEDDWEPLLTDRMFHGCGKINNKVIVAGGISNTSTSRIEYKTVEIIDIFYHQVKKGGEMVGSRHRFHIVVMREWEGPRMLALGGVGSNLVEEYNITTNSWSVMDGLGESREQYGAVAVSRGSACPPWNTWAPWTPCSKTCYMEGEARNGTITRSRQCGTDNQDMCSGVSIETATCPVVLECGKFNYK